MTHDEKLDILVRKASPRELAEWYLDAERRARVAERALELFIEIWPNGPFSDHSNCECTGGYCAHCALSMAYAMADAEEETECN